MASGLFQRRFKLLTSLLTSLSEEFHGLMTDISIGNFANGLVHIHEHASASRVGYAAVVISCGSRDEKAGEYGMAHFLEHCLFKGTVKRRAHHIINRLETVGAEIDAYTTKEYTCVYTVFMNEYFERALELMSDILFHSQFPEREIEREKNVVLDEILSYQDNPSEQIFEDFEKMAFAGHPLSGPILGSEKSVKSFTRKGIADFHARYYRPSNMILSTSVNEKGKKVNRLVHKYFSDTSEVVKVIRSKSEHRWKQFDQVLPRQNFQSHYLTGVKAYDLADDRRESLGFLSNILGGQAMNSRLNLLVREKMGLAYHIESSYLAYSDTGLFHIYLACDKKSIHKSENAIRSEVRKMREKKLSAVQMNTAKRQFQGQVSIAMESRGNRVMQRARSMMFHGRIESLEDVLRNIESVSSEDVWDRANEILDLNNFSRLIFENT